MNFMNFSRHQKQHLQMHRIAWNKTIPIISLKWSYTLTTGLSAPFSSSLSWMYCNIKRIILMIAMINEPKARVPVWYLDVLWICLLGCSSPDCPSDACQHRQGWHVRLVEGPIPEEKFLKEVRTKIGLYTRRRMPQQGPSLPKPSKSTSPRKAWRHCRVADSWRDHSALQAYKDRYFWLLILPTQSSEGTCTRVRKGSISDSAGLINFVSGTLVFSWHR